MAPIVFQTLSVDLVEHAETIASDFANRGYKVSPEKSELGYPYTPTLLCRRTPTTIFVEVVAQLSEEHIRAWVAFARSSGRDTRVAVCVPDSGIPNLEQERRLRDLGVGLYVCGNGNTDERIAPRDLALNVELPKLETLPPNIRTWLGPAYEQFARSQWREGFEEACKALEEQSRRHLKSGSRRGRIIIIGKKGPKRLTNAEIDKLTMGALAKTFANVQSQTHADSVLGQALSKANQDRIGVVHHKSKAVTENRLRKNVGHHMWMIIAALKELK